MERVAAQLEAAGFAVVPAIGVDTALRIARGRPLDGVVIGGGVPAADRARLKTTLLAINPELTVVEPDGPDQALPATLSAFPQP
jgi:hypothetical protein